MDYDSVRQYVSKLPSILFSIEEIGSFGKVLILADNYLHIIAKQRNDKARKYRFLANM